ncbi:hypothetical protein QKT48_gp02 [Macropodid alphaherpesvirus 4]|uniref:Uncharacterized protein n=1 Tax=Macropodid alphaherpesvirus 4 TaxID=2762721 RepID=A0A7L7YSE3_9ALPH|nr:hypothetical protein QKT48_gp02 [Macropodid alphaherpesvirus 4]QOD40160.1 hypothetical protein [Macropodid alphaherpesvirus 4]
MFACPSFALPSRAEIETYAEPPPFAEVVSFLRFGHEIPVWLDNMVLHVLEKQLPTDPSPVPLEELISVFKYKVQYFILQSAGVDFVLQKLQPPREPLVVWRLTSPQFTLSVLFYIIKTVAVSYGKLPAATGARLLDIFFPDKDTFNLVLSLNNFRGTPRRARSPPRRYRGPTYTPNLDSDVGFDTEEPPEPTEQTTAESPKYPRGILSANIFRNAWGAQSSQTGSQVSTDKPAWACEVVETREGDGMSDQATSIEPETRPAQDDENEAEELICKYERIDLSETEEPPSQEESSESDCISDIEEIPPPPPPRQASKGYQATRRCRDRRRRAASTSDSDN